MSEWRRVKVADIAAPTKGAIAIGPFGSAIKADQYSSAGVPVVRGQNIRAGKYLDTNDLVFVPEELAVKLQRSMVYEGDLVFPHRGAIGAVGLVGGQPFLLSSSMMKLTVDRAKADPAFILYYFRGPGRRELMTRASTVGTPGIAQPLSSLRDIDLNLPPVTLQRAIATVLSALDDKIAANTKIADTADALALAKIRTATAGRPTRPLGAIAKITMGSSPTGNSLNEDRVGVVFYQGVRDFGLRFPTPRVWTTAPTRWADNGDVLLSVRAPVGRVNLAPERLCIGRGLAAVRSVTDRQGMLSYLLRDPAVWAPYEAEGTVFGSINRNQLYEIQIPVVDGPEFALLEFQIGAIGARIASALRENQLLSATRDALLPALMSGRLAVREAEAAVEGAVDGSAVESRLQGTRTLW